MRLYSLLIIGFCSLNYSLIYSGSPKNKDYNKKEKAKQQDTSSSTVPSSQDNKGYAKTYPPCTCLAPHCPEVQCPNGYRRLSR